MNITALLHIIPLLVSASVMAHPELSGDALLAQVEGDVRHGLREYLDHTARVGWLIDAVWNITTLHDYFVNAIKSALAATTPVTATTEVPA